MSASPIEMPQVLPLAVVASGPSARLALKALAAMDANAAKAREVAVRLLAEHADGLPKLIAVGTEATGATAELTLQVLTAGFAELWAAALGVELLVSVEEKSDGRHTVYVRGKRPVDGVTVRVVSHETFSSKEWAARQVSGVAS